MPEPLHFKQAASIPAVQRAIALGRLLLHSHGGHDRKVPDEFVISAIDSETVGSVSLPDVVWAIRAFGGEVVRLEDCEPLTPLPSLMGNREVVKFKTKP